MPIVAASRRRSVAAVLALAGLVAFAPSAVAATYDVSMSDPYFASSNLQIPQGSRVRWNNDGEDEHNTISDQNFWSSNDLGTGQTYQRTFNAAGTFKYVCSIHLDEGMDGKVVVPVKLAATGRDITVTLAAVAAPTGYRHQLQRRKAGASTWTLVSTTAKSVLYHAPSAGTYEFRARYQKISGGLASNWSPIKTKTVS